MTTKSYEKAKELLAEIQELEDNVKKIERQNFCDADINVEGGNYRIPLYRECLPMPAGDFVKMYLMKAKDLLSELQKEFDNL